MKFRYDPKPRRRPSLVGCFVTGAIVILVAAFLFAVGTQIYKLVVR